MVKLPALAAALALCVPLAGCAVVIVTEGARWEMSFDAGGVAVDKRTDVDAALEGGVTVDGEVGR